MNAVHWREEYPEFAEWFISRCLPEPHSTKAIEDGVGWALDTDPETLIATVHGEQSDRCIRREPCAGWRENLDCPVLVVSRRARQDHAAPRRPRARPPQRRQARGGPRRRPFPARPQACPGQPGAARLLRGRLRAAAHAARPHRLPPRRPSARPLRLLADRARPRPARRGDRPRAAPPAPGPADRLARPGPGHPGARGRGRAHPPGQRSSGQRVPPHRVGVRRARPALLPRAAAHGRDPRRQLHALPRRRARRALRPLDRGRGLGARLLPAREPAREAGAVRVADRLRRLPADGRRRRAGELPDRRLQRRHGRPHRRPPRGPRHGAVRRQPRGHRRRSGSGRSCR